MSITTQEELKGMRAVAAVVRLALDAIKENVRPGVTTAELDEAGYQVIRENGGRSAPAIVYGFPGYNLISINNEAVHGIPGKRVVCDGDLVKLDVTVEKNGFMADAALTVPVGNVSSAGRRLVACAESAFHKAMNVARAGFRVSEIGRAVESEVQRNGFTVLRELGGHGIGRTIHEPPSVPNFYDPSANGVLTDGLVITIEPIISAGNGQSYVTRDGWTVRTTDHALSAHYEHTIVITKGKPILLTAA